MGQFKPMVKMYTTEPTVELKLKKGGAVAKPKKMMDGGVMGALSSAPAPVGVRGGMPAAARPAKPSMMARRRAMMGRPMMAEGGETKAEHASEMKKMASTEKKLAKHASMPASKAHKGLKTGGVVMGQGGFKEGGAVPKSGILPVSESERGGGAYVKTKMHTAEGGSHTPKKTGEVKMGNAGGYKKGGMAGCYAKGGGVEGNVSTSKPGVTNTTTGEVKKANAGGYKKGGSAKKAYATGGSVNDSGHPVAYPKKPASAPVKNNLQSGTFRKGGKVKMAEGGKLEDLSKGAYDKSIGPSKEEMDVAESIRSLPKTVLDQIRRVAKSMPIYSGSPESGSVTKTEKSVTVTPAKKRGGSVKC